MLIPQVELADSAPANFGFSVDFSAKNIKIENLHPCFPENDVCLERSRAF